MKKPFSSTAISRRSFLGGLGALSLGTLIPAKLHARLDYHRIRFDRDIFERNKAQTIIIFLYGGPSELAGNLTNIEEISRKSQTPYPLDDDRYITLTRNKLWAQAGGIAMEEMLANGELNLFRTCYRTVDDLKSHGDCTSQAQRGTDLDGGAGILANLAAILHHHKAIREPKDRSDIGKSIPFVTLEGESTFFSEDDLNLAPFLKPVAISSSSRNPYTRGGWFNDRVLNHNTGQTIGKLFDRISTRHNSNEKIKEAFERRKDLAAYVDEINALELPEGVEYPSNNEFADLLATSMKLLIHNPHTKMISMGSPGLGGWDDHSNALNEYTYRMTRLMEAIRAAMDHMAAEGRNNINIVVFGEFGRNVNYNTSLGWDHGNNQNIYWFGGKDYFRRMGIVGKTEVSGEDTRLYLQPKRFGKANESYHFQIFSVAATLYRLYGITNPKLLTQGNAPIKGLLKS